MFELEPYMSEAELLAAEECDRGIEALAEQEAREAADAEWEALLSWVDGVAQ